MNRHQPQITQYFNRLWEVFRPHLNPLWEPGACGRWFPAHVAKGSLVQTCFVPARAEGTGRIIPCTSRVWDSVLQLLLAARGFPLPHQMGPQTDRELLVSQLTGVIAWTWQPPASPQAIWACPSPCKLPSCIFQVTAARVEGKAFELSPAKESRWDCIPFWALGRGGCCFSISSLCSSLPVLSQPSGWRMICSLAERTTTTTTKNNALCCYRERSQGTAAVGCWFLTFVFLSSPPSSPHSPLGVEACDWKLLWVLFWNLLRGVKLCMKNKYKCQPWVQMQSYHRLASALVKISR